MSQWKNRIDEPGWYWFWQDHDWGYNEPFSEEGRQPQLYLFFIIKKDHAVGLNKAILTEPTFSIIFEETNWFMGPIMVPNPPLPAKDYIENLRKKANGENESHHDRCISKILKINPDDKRKNAKKQLNIALKRIEEYNKEQNKLYK